MVDFIALDVETANSRRSSACSIGVVVVRNSVVVDSFYSLLRPTPAHFDPINVKIHGITERAVSDAPDFPSVWTRLQPLIENDTVAAYNASFDMSVLHASLQAHELPPRPLRYSCILQLARSAWPGLNNYKLATVASELGIHFRHHNAGSDAEACAKIAIEAAKELGLRNLPVQQYSSWQASGCGTSALDEFRALLVQIMSDLRLTPSELKQIDTWLIRHSSMIHRWPYSEIARQLERIYEDGKVTELELAATATFVGAVLEQMGKGNKASEELFTCSADEVAFSGKVFVFTGEMETLSRDQAENLVQSLGGVCSKSVTRQTDYLVVGLKGSDAWKGHGRGTKIEKAIELRRKGIGIHLVSETEFLRALI